MTNVTHWVGATLQSTTDLTPTVRELVIQSDAGPALGYDSGAHLQFQLLVNGRPQVRSYSLIGPPDTQAYRVAVKRLDDGRGGSRAMWALVPGARLQISAPQNHFALDLSAPAYLLVAGGIGITPLVGMAQRLASHCAKTGASLRMVYGARSAGELAYLGTLREALGQRVQAFVTGQGEPVNFAAEIAALPAGGQLYTCGPVPMLETVKRAWAQAQRPLSDLRFETFGSSGRYAAQAFTVHIPRQHLSITVPADTSLLDALEQAGVQTLSDCRRGECGLCAMEVLAVDGVIDHRDVFLSEHEKHSGQRICACVSRAVGSVTLDSAYRAD
ncbi:MAG: hypothetical protein RLZZ401_1721 [Pseudomonadota bacterium]